MNVGELEKILPPVKDWEACTPKSIRDKDAFFKELELILKQGYAVDDEEYDHDVKCVGAAIRDYTKRVVAGISISGPSFRLTDKQIKERIAPAVQQAAAEISRRLGYEVTLHIEEKTAGTPI
jgi:DNA-binding IclR family transcriptional regulator